MGETEWMNPYGYLNGDELGFLPVLSPSLSLHSLCLVVATLKTFLLFFFLSFLVLFLLASSTW